MHANSTAATAADLHLERLPSGELAWLRPAAIQDEADARYVVTDLGRRMLATEALFGPWPTVAEASAA